VDTRNLAAIYGNEPERLARVLSEWCAGIEEGVQIIVSGFASQRLEAAVEAAHRIKGSAGIVGAYGHSADAAALETALRAGDTAAARAAARKVEATAVEAVARVRQTPGCERLAQF
jgi:HPt (histidine-containing phosphotransfer) domain-containing protein